MRVNLAVKRGDSLSIAFNCLTLRSQPQPITGCTARLELTPTDGSEPGTDDQMIYTTDPDGGLVVLASEGKVLWEIPYQVIDQLPGNAYQFDLKLIYPNDERASTETMFLSIIED